MDALRAFGRCTTAVAVILAAKVATADAPPPPPPPPCTTDADCPGCQRCENGFCPGYEVSGPVCLCNDECVGAGLTSCDLSTTKPRCGGRCTNNPAPRALTCGAGDDLVIVAPMTSPISDNADGVHVVAPNAVVVERLKAAP
jgi:hypothetical protein